MREAENISAPEHLTPESQALWMEVLRRRRDFDAADRVILTQRMEAVDREMRRGRDREGRRGREGSFGGR